MLHFNHVMAYNLILHTFNIEFCLLYNSSIRWHLFLKDYNKIHVQKFFWKSKSSCLKKGSTLPSRFLRFPCCNILQSPNLTNQQSLPLKLGGLGDDSFPFGKACLPIFRGQLLVSHHSISPRTSSWNGAISSSHTHTQIPTNWMPIPLKLFSQWINHIICFSWTNILQ